MDKDNLKGTMTVQITGPAGDESLFQQVKKHELHHTEDNMEIGEKGLALWESVTPSSLPEKPQKLAKVQEDIAALKDLNPPKLEVAEDLINNWEKASADYHDSDKGKTKIDFERTAYNAEENKLTIVLDLTA